MIWWYPTIYKNETIYLSALSNEANIIFDFLHWTTIERKFPKCYDYICRLLKYIVPQFVQTIIWWFIFTSFYSIWYVCTISSLNHIKKNKTITVGFFFCLIRWFQKSSNCINNITNIHNIHIHVFIIYKCCCTDIPLLSNPIL